MNPTTRNSLILVFLLIMAATCSIIWIARKEHQRYQDLQTSFIAEHSELVNRRNDQGKLISEKMAAQLSASELQKSIPRLARQMQRDFDMKLKNFKAYSKTSFEASGHGMAGIEFIPYDTSGNYIWIDTMSTVLSITATKLPRGPGYYYLVDQDTINVMTDVNGRPLFSFTPFAVITQDGYLDYQADVYNELNAPYSYTYSDTLQYAFLMKRDKWYQKKKLYGSAVMSNKNAKVMNTDAYWLRDYREKRFGIGPYVGFGLGANGIGWNVGVSVHYSLIQF